MNLQQSITTDQSFDLHWQMTNCERVALQYILNRIRPNLSIEVGSYLGGSLQVISYFSKNVVSIDSDPSVIKNLENIFSNVDFRIGNSSYVLSTVIDEYNNSGNNIDFILLDGDHSKNGILKDINSLLRYKPVGNCIVLIHDSFNPDCREGLKIADWQSSPFIQMVELDFMPGVYHEKAHDTAKPKTMWGGFACAVFSPEFRRQPLLVQASQQGLFDAVYRASSHNQRFNFRSKLKNIVRLFRGQR